MKKLWFLCSRLISKEYLFYSLHLIRTFVVVFVVESSLPISLACLNRSGIAKTILAKVSTIMSVVKWHVWRLQSWELDQTSSK